MGGKTWSLKEEIIFWREIVRLAPVGSDDASKQAKGNFRMAGNLEKSWKPLAELMTRKMSDEGVEQRRKYTAISCYEHYFQNYKLEKYSRFAKPQVDKYKKWLADNANATPSTTPTSSSANKTRRSGTRSTRTSASIAASHATLGSASTSPSPNPTSEDIAKAARMAQRGHRVRSTLASVHSGMEDQEQNQNMQQAGMHHGSTPQYHLDRKPYFTLPPYNPSPAYQAQVYGNHYQAYHNADNYGQPAYAPPPPAGYYFNGQPPNGVYPHGLPPINAPTFTSAYGENTEAARPNDGGGYPPNYRAYTDVAPPNNGGGYLSNHQAFNYNGQIQHYYQQQQQNGYQVPSHHAHRTPGYYDTRPVDHQNPFLPSNWGPEDRVYPSLPNLINNKNNDSGYHQSAIAGGEKPHDDVRESIEIED